MKVTRYDQIKDMSYRNISILDTNTCDCIQ